jgi:Bacterial PH domain
MRLVPPEESYQRRPYIDKYLLLSERTVFVLRQHPAKVVPSLAEAIGGLLVAFAVGSVSGNARSTHLLVWILAAFLVIRAFLEIANWLVQNIVLTDQRLILTSGLFSRKVMAFPLIKLLDMSFHRSTAGSLFGYGTFSIESAGGRAKAVIDYIPYPEQLYLEVTNLLYPDSAIWPEDEGAHEGQPDPGDPSDASGGARRFGIPPETGPGRGGRPEEAPGAVPDGGAGGPGEAAEPASDHGAGEPPEDAHGTAPDSGAGGPEEGSEAPPDDGAGRPGEDL